MNRRLDHRLDSVHDTLSLAYQFLLALAEHGDEFLRDASATVVLTRLVGEARDNADILREALPIAIGVVEVEDDVRVPGDRGLPLRPLLEDYRKRFGSELLAVAMDGEPANAPRSSRRRKAA